MQSRAEIPHGATLPQASKIRGRHRRSDHYCNGPSNAKELRMREAKAVVEPVVARNPRKVIHLQKGIAMSMRSLAIMFCVALLHLDGLQAQ